MAEALALLVERHGPEVIVLSDPELLSKVVREEDAQVAVVEVDEPAGPMLAAIRELRDGGHQLPIISLAGAVDARLRRRTLVSGSNALLPRSLPGVALMRAMERLLSGDPVLIDLTETNEKDRPGPAIELTDRERDVLEALLLGDTTSELADRLGIRLTSARTYVQRVLCKLGVHTRPAAVAKAVSLGLVRVDARHASAVAGQATVPAH